MELRLRTDIRALVIERVRKHLLDRTDGVSIAIASEGGALDPVEPAQIVKPGDVVRMRMCEQHRVHAADVVCEALNAQLRRGVDENRATVELHQRARACALVARIAGSADRAI